MDSYLAYQIMKKREYGMMMADKYWPSGLTVAEVLCSNSEGPGHQVSSEGIKRFGKFYPPALRQ